MVAEEQRRHRAEAHVFWLVSSEPPIKAFESATWQRSSVRWSQVSLGDKTLEREEDDQK